MLSLKENENCLFASPPPHLFIRLDTRDVHSLMQVIQKFGALVVAQ